MCDVEFSCPACGAELEPATGICIRAQVDSKWDNVDIIDKRISDEEIVKWLRSRGGYNPWAEATVMLLLGRDAEAVYRIEPPEESGSS